MFTNFMSKLQGVDKPVSDKFTTLLDVIPRPLFKDVKECAQHVELAQQYLVDREKDIATPDEVSFIIVVDRYIEFFERAKAMLARGRFTVKYHGNQMVEPNITDYEIVSLSKEEKEDQKGL